MDAGFGPLFPFGYGLSYTSFNYENISLSSHKLSADDTLTAEVTVRNIGQYQGTEVVQLYVRDHVGSVTRPVKELKGFQRVTLIPGEKKTVTFNLSMDELKFWNIDNQKVLEPGKFTLWLGTNSDEGLSQNFEVINE